jgi:PAS domain-containing protein
VVVYWDWDLDSGRVNWNGPLHELTGLSQDAPADQRTWWEERIHPEDLPSVRDGIRALVEGATVQWQGVYRLRTGGGSYRHINDRIVVALANGRPRRLVGVAQSLDAPAEVREDAASLLEKLR